jgi:hypothetical protein
MRKLFILTLFCSIPIFYSCSVDDNNENNKETYESLLIGDWEFNSDPGYGDPTFFINGRVEFHYYKEAWNDDFSEWGDWTLEQNNLKIYWDDSDSGLDIYETEILELTNEKLRWNVEIDGEVGEESFTRK